MSKLARVLALVAMLAALAGPAAVAQAHPADSRRPPTEARVGEAWRMGQATVHQPSSADATVQRLLARERPTIPDQGPVQLPAQTTNPMPAAEPGGQPSWLTPALGALSALLALVAGVAVLAARRATRSLRASQTA